MDNVAKLVVRVTHYDSYISKVAKQELLLLGKKAVPHLVGALSSSNPVVVTEVTRLLGIFRKDAVDAVEALVTISYINNSKIRANAIASLGLIAEKANVCIPVLKHHLKDEEANIRRHAVAALGVFGHATNSAVYELVDALEDEDPVVREFAAGILYERGSVPIELVKRIVIILGNADTYVRYPLIKLLNKISCTTGLSITDLIAADTDPPGNTNNYNSVNKVVQFSVAS